MLDIVNGMWSRCQILLYSSNKCFCFGRQLTYPYSNCKLCLWTIQISFFYLSLGCTKSTPHMWGLTGSVLSKQNLGIPSCSFLLVRILSSLFSSCSCPNSNLWFFRTDKLWQKIHPVPFPYSKCQFPSKIRLFLFAL